MKTMKKVLALVLVMALTAVAAVNLTLAYLQDQDEAVNVMTLGNVYIDQIEQERGEDGALNEFTQDKPLYPAVGELVKEGDYWTANNVVDKIVSVKNTGESSAYVRTIFAFEKASGMADLVHKNINDTDWTWEKDVIEINIDGVTYTVWVATYPQALAIGATTPASLIQVALDKTADNDYVNALGEYDILVVSQAIQTMGFENVGAQAALVEGFGPITTDNHPWLNGIIGERWDGSADPEGLVPSENDPNLYEIYTPAQLKAFADSVNGTAASTFSLRASNVGNTYAGCTVKLMADIDLNNMAWTPIGPNADASNKFAGTFDGQGHTISNLKVVTEPGYTAAGLFGSLNGTAKNFTIKNATISHISTGAATDNGIAVVAGSLYNSGAVDNVHVVNATVTGNRYVGGISGYTYGSVTNCSVKNVKLVATPDNQGGSYDNGDKVGGIAGYFASVDIYSISGNTVTDATIQAYRDFGGVVGCANGADKVTGNTVSGLTLIQDNTNAYKSEPITTYGEIVGRIADSSVLGSNTVSGNTDKFNGTMVAEGVMLVGTKNYQVLDKAGLMNIGSVLVSAAPNEANIQTVDLMADVDLKGETWEPIASMWVTFNGNGHTISNLKAGLAADGRRSGFWAYAGGVTINDLTLHNVDVTGSQAGIFAGAAEGLKVNNCYLTGKNTVTFVPGVETWNGVGAITGVLTDSNINVEITAGTTVTVNKGTMTTDPGCVYVDALTGYIQKNKGTVTNNGTVKVLMSATDSASLAQAVKDGATTVNLSAGTYEFPSMEKGVTIVGEEGVVFADTLSGTLDDVTIKNVEIKADNAQRWAYAHGTLVFENCTFDASSVYAIHYDGLNGANITYKNCKIVGWAAIGGGAEHITFDGCEIYGNGSYGVLRLYSPCTIKNCTFDVSNVNTNDVYQDGIHAVDCEIVVENCTNVNGTVEDLFNISGTGVITKK